MQHMGFRNCKFCNERFSVRRDWQIFCSNPCKVRWHSTEKEKLCFYCGHTAHAREHVYPARYASIHRRFQGVETVPVCNECNSILGALPAALDDRFYYLIKRFSEKHRLQTGKVQWDDDELKELGAGLKRRIKAKIAKERLNRERLAYMHEAYDLLEKERLGREEVIDIFG